MADDKLILPSREQLEERGLRAWQIRNRQATGRFVKIGDNSLPRVAVGMAVALIAPMFANAARVARRVLVAGNTGDVLDELANEHGIDGKRPATGSVGYVAASIRVGGSTILAGDQLKHDASKLLFEVSTTATYYDGDPIPIRALSSGVETNLEAGQPLTFINPRPGCSDTALIQEQNDGTGTLVGLFGGAPAETDEDVQGRIIEARANPPASGNNAEIILAASKTGGVPIQRVWVIPAWYGPGNTAVVFTLRPNARTGSRIPSSAHYPRVQAQLEGIFPTDFRIVVCQTRPITVDVMARVTWLSGARGWANGPSLWPANKQTVAATPTPTNTSMRVSNFIPFPNPQPGTVFGLYDRTTGKFRKKRIKTVVTVSAQHTYDITFDMANGASDTYVPVAGQMLCPWSESLNALPAQVAKVFGGLGPGEQFALLKDPGSCQRRYPPSPDTWPSVLTNVDLISGLKASQVVADADVVAPSTPYATPVGVPGVFSCLLELGDLGFYPQ